MSAPSMTPQATGSGFELLVWSMASQLGRRSGPIADVILRLAFPRTALEAEIEGADKMLRNGLRRSVNRILHHKLTEGERAAFIAIDERFAPLVRKLHSTSYYVESRGEQVPLAELIAHPPLLHDARRYLRRKGAETIAVSGALDELFFAVTASAA
jgi:hypothetical protein